MRERYYVIDAYDVKADDRFRLFETDYLIPAIWYWFMVRIDKQYKYETMTIRA